MSCCGGNCGCGSSCGCGNGCGGCKMFADVENQKMNISATMVLGFEANKASLQGFEMAGSSENGCPCGSSSCCSDPCYCRS